MAERTGSRADEGNSSINTWSGLLNTDTGDKFAPNDHVDISIQVIGTPSAGGTVILEGSNDGTNWGALSDQAGNAISLTAAGAIKAVGEVCKFYRPNVTGGDGSTDVTALIYMLRPRS